MSDGDSQLAKRREEATPKQQSDDVPPPPDGYFAISPNGTKIEIPMELFVAFRDFLKTRKVPGTIAIQFRGGEIVCVEALARKIYRSHEADYGSTTKAYLGNYSNAASETLVEPPSRLLKSEEFDIIFDHNLSQIQ